MEAFAEFGYHDCQVAKIARKAGIADGTIYLYFANKEEILISVFREKMTEVLSEMSVLVEQQDSAMDKIAALVRFHLSYFEDNPVLANFFQVQLRQSSFTIRAGITEPLRQYYRFIETLLRAGIEEGCIRPQVDVKVAREVVFGSLDEIVSCWVFSSRKYSLAAKADDLLAIIRFGLVNQ